MPHSQARNFVRFAQIGQLFPRGNKGFLRQVLALAQTARGAVGQRTDERLILRDDLPEGIAVPGQAFTDQFGVVENFITHGLIVIVSPHEWQTEPER